MGAGVIGTFPTHATALPEQSHAATKYHASVHFTPSFSFSPDISDATLWPSAVGPSHSLGAMRTSQGLCASCQRMSSRRTSCNCRSSHHDNLRGVLSIRVCKVQKKPIVAKCMFLVPAARSVVSTQMRTARLSSPPSIATRPLDLTTQMHCRPMILADPLTCWIWIAWLSGSRGVLGHSLAVRTWPCWRVLLRLQGDAP